MRGLSFEEKPAEFSPLYLPEPERNTAACNAGDYFLYLGGGSINGAFGKLISGEHELEMDTEFHPRKSPVQMEYMELHQLLLKASRERDGALVAASELSGAAELLKSLYLADSFCVSGEACGEEDPRYAAAVGSAILDVFEEPKRLLHQRNVAMLYVVGPKGEGSKSGQGPLFPTDKFLSSVEQLGRASLKLVADYNKQYAAVSDGRLPPVEEVRWCLVSGGVYKPPDATKEDVARATLKGIVAVQDRPLVTFTYDEDCFRLAFEAMARA